MVLPQFICLFSSDLQFPPVFLPDAPVSQGWMQEALGTAGVHPTKASKCRALPSCGAGDMERHHTTV